MKNPRQSFAYRLSAVLGVSLRYMGMFLPCCVLGLTAIASFCFLKAFDAAFPGSTAVDALIWAFDPSAGISLLWVVSPAIFMTALSYLWKEKERAHIIVAYGSEGRMFASYLSDVVVLALSVTMVLLGVLLLCGYVIFGSASNFDSPSSLMAAYTEETLEGFDLASSLPVFFVYGFLSLMFSGMAFYTLRAICKNTVLAWGIVIACGLPQIHGSTSFIYDAAKAVGMNMPIVNPLSYLYESSGVFYPSWLPGASHGFWVLVLIVACLIGIGFVVTKGREYLRA